MRRRRTDLGRRRGPGAGLAALVLLAWGCGDAPLPTALEPAADQGAPVYTASGVFQRLGYPASGRATYTLDAAGVAALSFDASFSVPEVPRVWVFLSDDGRIQSGVRVGALASPAGAQRWTFRVPRGAVWRWAVLWSEELRVDVARARLSP